MSVCLVTGAGGFVGANLVRALLARGDDVHAVARSGGDRWRLAGLDGVVAVHETDLRERDAVFRLVGRVRPDLVFHLAAHGAYSWQTDTTAILETNLLGTVHLLDATVERGFAAFVHAGSSSEYGFADHAPGEGDRLEPNSVYAVGKAAATMYCGHVGRSLQLPVCTLRLYSVYGPWEEPGRLVPRLLEHAARDSLPPLAGPETGRDFVFVDDVVDAFLSSASRPPPPGDILNIGSGQQTTLRQIVDIVRRRFDVAREPTWGSMPDRAWDAEVWVSDPSRARRVLGWWAATSLEEGLAKTAAWLADDAPADRYRS